MAVWLAGSFLFGAASIKDLWAVFPIAMCGFAGWLLMRDFRIRTWEETGKCRQCGYSLTGNTSGVCPECGAEIK